MKNIAKYILFAGLFAFGMASCSDDDGVTPSEITNLKSETRAGEIVLRWDKPTDGTVEYVKVVYDDPRLNKTVVRLASAHGDSILIPDTRARYGEYQFTVFTVSSTGDESGKQSISQISEAGLVVERETSTSFSLTAESFSSNASHAEEGKDFGNLIDGDVSTIWHSDWSSTKPALPHWLQVDLGEELVENYIQFTYTTRNSSSAHPSVFDFQGSTDGTEWFTIKTFTADDELPNASSTVYKSPLIPVTQSFSHIRMSVTASYTGGAYWVISEFGCSKAVYTRFDPEDPDQDLEDVV